MAFNDAIKNGLASMVTACRKLLAEDISAQFQQRYGMQPNGSAAPVEQLMHLDDRGRALAATLREWHAHLSATESGPPADRLRRAFERMAHETAFTYLNRLAALRMCEERGLVFECVRRGIDSDGFGVFLRVAEVALGDRWQTYRVFLERMFDELAVDLGTLFDRRLPHSRVFPGERCLEQVLARLNDVALAAVWGDDETIGWIYQYFHSDAERRQMRDDSPAPSNSRELAVRNQFFTPRYVVQFLTDNTLGRIWYEMSGGETRLTEECEFLVRRPNEVIANGKLDEAACDPFRAPKDPRDIKVLDPACGSGHFLLYAFDLLLQIYDEAWESNGTVSEATGSSLRDDWPDRAVLSREAPALILRHNLYGIDIDPRAVQIAQLALWLRAQRAFRDMGLKGRERPTITKTNLVCAEPMPGEAELLDEFLARLESQPVVVGRLMREVFARMQSAALVGSLLPIERELAELVEQAKREYFEWQRLRRESKGYLLTDMAPEARRTLFDFADSQQYSDAAFWGDVERQVLEALRGYAENGGAVRGQHKLFADDAARGFAFIDICRVRFDVVLMNPPFGDPPEQCRQRFVRDYPLTSGDLYAMFYERALGWLTEHGRVGAITNRTWVGLPTFEDLRAKVFGVRGAVEVAADLGSFVLDAQVETLAAVVAKDATTATPAFWVRLLKTGQKEATLRAAIEAASRAELHRNAFVSPAARYERMPRNVYGYWMSDELVSLYDPAQSIDARVADVKQGTVTADDFRFLRLAWEVDSETIGLEQRWPYFAKGGEYSPFYDDVHLVLNWDRDGRELIAWGRGRPQNTKYFGAPGVTWPLRTTSAFGPRAFPAGCAFGHKGPAALPRVTEDASMLLGVLTTRPIRLLLSVRLGAGDDAPGSASKSYEVGLIKALPYPELNDTARQRVRELTLSCVGLVRAEAADTDETSLDFALPSGLDDQPCASLKQAARARVARREDRLIELAEQTAELDTLVADALRFSVTDRAIMDEELEVPLQALDGDAAIEAELFRRAYLTKDALPGDQLPGGVAAEGDVRVKTRRKRQQRLRTEPTLCRLFGATPRRCATVRRELGLIRAEDERELAAGLVSWLVGVAFGRWDVRLARDRSRVAPTADPFAPLPRVPLGLLVTAGDDYPLALPPDGVLVDDERADGLGAHADDLAARVATALRRVAEDRAEAIAEEACELLGVANLRAYLRDPNGFFADHWGRYFKSRRRAPIYWPLQVGSTRYGIWIYYPRLSQQTLFASLNHVNSRLFDERARVVRLQERLATSEGGAASELRDEAERARALATELQELQTELQRVAELPYKPSLDDGVAISAAPLWKLFRHGACRDELQAHWQALNDEEYEWSKLARAIWPERVEALCRSDLSVAIAHGLEHLCEPPVARRGRGRRAATAEAEVSPATKED
ncbi:MAG TPA: BREX-1 system adenine-specific DNA-methyltransferase PglX [Pirellulales bacterium]|nr:BREX-1 system adenine-specific DNA-methyltransferase PglX [Pirellulales bacterium]